MVAPPCLHKKPEISQNPDVKGGVATSSPNLVDQWDLRPPEITNTHMDKVSFCFQNIILPSMQPPTFWRQL